MRNFMIAIAGASALALSSVAGAAVTVVPGSTVNLNNPDPAAALSTQTTNGVTTINFGQNPAASTTFTGGFSVLNDAAGLFSIVVQSSDTGITFTSGSLTGPGGPFTLSPGTIGGFSVLTLGPVSLGVGTFALSFAGSNPVSGGSFTGNVTMRPAVPEPATWGMMLLGFGAMGLVIRRRQPVLAQIA